MNSRPRCSIGWLIRLLNLLHEAAPGLHPADVLEIGCCTGLLTEKTLTRFPGIDHFTICDLVASFEQRVCRRIGIHADKITFLAGDIETVPLADRYDLVISSSTLHWVHDLPGLCANFTTTCTKMALLAFSLYGKDNLREIRTVTGMGLAYRNLEQLRTRGGGEISISWLRRRHGKSCGIPIRSRCSSTCGPPASIRSASRPGRGVRSAPLSPTTRNNSPTIRASGSRTIRCSSSPSPDRNPGPRGARLAQTALQGNLP